MISYDDITVCMVHFNRPVLLQKVVPSYKNFKHILIWDNCSEKKHQLALRVLDKKHKNVHPFWSYENVGWPEAMNYMVAHSDTEWVLMTAEDMLLGNNFMKDANELLEWKPNLEQIYLHTFDSMLFHKKTFARFGWWEERQNQVAPVAEDDDWYLRLVEYLSYSPYVYPGDHIMGEERKKRLKHASTKELMERDDNISYFSNCRWGISSINFQIKELSRDKAYIQQYNKNKGPSGLEFHHKKWERTDDEDDLLNKDGTFWRRKMSDYDPYPKIREQLRNKYNVY